MKGYLIDIPVLLIFFNRPDTFEQVFEKIKEVRPSRLYLACDGPRDGNADDAIKIEKCKQIADSVDWECMVYKNYADKNLGCGIRPESAISWVFESTDRIVILEDDCIPDNSFWPYMEEMLEKYKSDERIGLISGFNHFQHYACGEFSYCFTKTGATLGWGTWKRVWDKYDYYITDAEQDYYMRILRKEIYNSKASARRIERWKYTRQALKEGRNISWWDHQFGFIKYVESFLVAVPKTNLIYNIGVGQGSSHAEHLTKKKWELGEVCFMPTTPLEFPLVHQRHVVCDRDYDEMYFNKIAYSSVFRRIVNKVKRMIGN